MANFDIADMKRRMQGAVNVLHEEFSGLRTGRASASLLEPVVVDAYGSTMPLNPVGTISVPDPRLLTVQVLDRGLVKAVEKAIRDAGLGLNPQSDGGLVRVPVPELSQERRTELSKIAGKYAEKARIAVRNIRREGMDDLKQMEKDHDISEDDHERKSEEVQKATDEAIKQIDAGLVQKEKDIQQI